MAGSGTAEVLGVSAADAAKLRNAKMIKVDFMVTLPSLSIMRIVLLASALTLAATPAFPELLKSREEALAQLSGADSTGRLEAIVWFANHGNMADTKLLEEKLRDEDPFVRAYAERGLWAIWTRSGDAAIDELMARGVQQMEEGD